MRHSEGKVACKHRKDQPRLPAEIPDNKNLTGIKDIRNLNFRNSELKNAPKQKV